MLPQLTGDQARLLRVLFPHLDGLEVAQVGDLSDSVRITVRTGTAPVLCRGCQMASVRVHDRYRRYLHDLACGGRPVQIVLETRRLRCTNPACPVATFAEQVPGVTERHQRRTAGLRGLLEHLALALAGRAGSRLAAVLGMPVSRCTLIRLLRALPDPPIGQVTVLGVDDFAKRKGHSYASVLINMDTHQVIDVLPDREADTFAGWLREHPGVQVICRDRAGAYALGASEGAPQAIQVADRFHLWQNLSEAVEKTVITHRATLPEPALAPEPGPEGQVDPGDHAAPDPTAVPLVPLAEPIGFYDSAGRQRRLIARHRERYAAVHALLAEGHSHSAIGRKLRLNRHTVARFAHAPSIDQVLFQATHRAGILDDFKPYLGRRWNAGVTDATVLYGEIQAQGFTGSVQTVRAYLRPLRGTEAAPKAAPATPAPPKPRRVTRWIMTHPDRLTGDDAAHLATIVARSPELAATAGHVRSFAAMMTTLQGHRLDEWISAVRADPLPDLHSFTNGLERDQTAVLAGLTLPYSSGAVEGRICKIKFLKRLMFGRANYDLLRTMILHN